MDASTGKLYESREAAVKAGVKPANLLMMSGPPAAIRSVSRAVKKVRRERHQATMRKRAARAKGRQRKGARWI